jgi:pimeloyl-ACP methyl ester carboxylesterase
MKHRVISFILILCGFFASAQNAIDKKEIISIDGIKHMIWIKGDDQSKPLFLFLHGGPGNSVMPYANKFCDQLYQHFVVVHWDQRESGETLKLNASSLPLSFELFKKDAEQLVDSLLKRFNRPTLYVAGHSWGTALGFHLVRNRPQQLEAFIAIGSMVNQLESERIALDTMKEKAKRSKNESQLNDLEKIKIPFESGEQLFYHRKGLAELSGAKSKLTKGYVNEWANRWLNVFNEASSENLFESLPNAKCPVYFFAGRNDLQTNSYLVEKYYEKLNAPAKKFYWFEKAGHSIPSSDGRKFQKLVIEEILSTSH